MMAVNTESEQDLRLKLRMMRYLWHLGYFVRKNVGIVEILEEGKMYTDIDVLGVKLDKELDASFIACDCKSGAHIKTRERLFWLAGVMKYFGTPQGIFIRTKMMGNKYIDLAETLGILPLSEHQLDNLEKFYRIDANKWFGAFCAEHARAEEIFSLLKRFSPQTYNYIRIGYWEDSPPQQITSLVACCKRICEMRELKNKAKSFLLAHALSALSLSIIQFSKSVLVIPDSEKENYIRLGLLGGKLRYAEREALLKSFYDFMAKEIEERYKTKYPITKSQFIDSLVPEYSKYFVDLVLRICENPTYSIIAPRLFDLLAFESVLNERNIQLQDIIQIPANTDIDLLVKPTKDFVTFAERSKFITGELVKTFNKQASRL